MIKKTKIFIWILVLILLPFYQTNAIKIVSEETYEKLNSTISLEDMINFFGDSYTDVIPETYKYIEVKIKWVEKWSETYENLQKLIYVDVLDNLDTYLRKNSKPSAYSFYKFAEKNYWIDFIDSRKEAELKSKKVKFKDFEELEKKIDKEINTFELKDWNKDISKKKAIFSDVYETISSSHYERKNLDNKKMIEDATKALADSIWDKYTVYFPATMNKDFIESLNWEYEWIGAYVDMEKPGIFTIISPLPNSPAEKSWLKWWDIVTHVDKREITEKDSIEKIISLIKWKAGTKVTLTIKRWEKEFDLDIIRSKINMREVEAEKLDNETYYIKMNFFWPNISQEFREALDILKDDKKIKKIIFDLRWNGWGYLDQVSEILWNFIEKWEKTAVVKYLNDYQNYYSKGTNDIDFSKYKLIALENWGTASASEIFIWTLKDYYPSLTVIWEKSYGKGSVQSIKNYVDWSSLKFTVAKWYTWKNQIGIDEVWIKPDIEIKMDSYWVEVKDDLQLQKAIDL